MYIDSVANVLTVGHIETSAAARVVYLSDRPQSVITTARVQTGENLKFLSIDINFHILKFFIVQKRHAL